MTWAEYIRLGQGYRRRELDKWRRHRWAVTQLLNIQIKPEERLSPEALLPLPGEALYEQLLTQPAAVPMVPETPEETMARLRLLDPDKFS